MVDANSSFYTWNLVSSWNVKFWVLGLQCGRTLPIVVKMTKLLVTGHRKEDCQVARNWEGCCCTTWSWSCCSRHCSCKSYCWTATCWGKPWKMLLSWLLKHSIAITADFSCTTYKPTWLLWNYHTIYFKHIYTRSYSDDWWFLVEDGLRDITMDRHAV